MIHESAPSKLLTEELSDESIEKLTSIYGALSSQQAVFFIANKDLQITSLKEAIKHDKPKDNLVNFDISEIYFCFSDPSEYEYPGWMLRNYILMLHKLCPVLHGKSIKILSVRQQEALLKSSRIFYVNIPDTKLADDLKWTGWEKNNQGKLLPKATNMSEVMDPMRTAEHFATLNLKLMKWRLMPSLNLEVIKKQKCLLFGAGTLGCGIARSLMSWGFSNISFIDSGHVAYSNPVRQSLFTYADASQNKFKATAAAERLKEILPSIVSMK